MTNYKLKTKYKKMLADTITPVSIYLKIRDRFAKSILLESSDYHSNDNSYSYICCNPIARFEVGNSQIEIEYPDKKVEIHPIKDRSEVISRLEKFSTSFETDKNDFAFSNNGLFGYMTYDTVRYFEDIEIRNY